MIKRAQQRIVPGIEEHAGTGAEYRIPVSRTLFKLYLVMTRASLKDTQRKF